VNALWQALPWYAAPCLALLAGVCALAPFGAQVLARGVVFIDLAVAQAAAAGALAGVVLFGHTDRIAMVFSALTGAWLCVALVAGLVRYRREAREALIGLLYVLGASGAVLAAGMDPHGHEHLTELLAADVLWATWSQASGLGGLALLSVWAWRLGWLRRDAAFYAAFALVVSGAVAVLGLLVVFACLIVPALWRRAGASAAAATALAGAAALLGVGLSWQRDWPSGACVAAVMALWGLASILPRRAQ
jgi:zinc/manganese transport system permease protein